MKKRDRKFLSVALSALLALSMSISAVTAEGQAGTTLSASVNADGFNNKIVEYDWSIEKSVDPENLEMEQGETETVQYTIEAERGEPAVTYEQGVSGSASVTNGGDRATEGLKIVMVVEYKIGSGQFQPISGASQTIVPATQLDPGETKSYNYEINYTPISGATYRVTANVTITNHSGQLGSEFGPSPKADFSLPQMSETIIDEDADIADVHEPNDDFSWVLSDAGPWNLNDSDTITFTSDITNDSGEYGETYELKNTATLTESDTSQKREDDAIITVSSNGNGEVLGTISGMKFYDLDANGAYDPSTEFGLEGWKISLLDENDNVVATAFTDSLGGYTFSNIAAGNYKVKEEWPNDTAWSTVMPTEISIEIGEGADLTGYDFGNYYLTQAGGKTIGFWSNKNGYKQLNDGNTIVPEMELLISLNLVWGNGNPYNSTNYNNYLSFMNSASATNMANMLSAQLAALALSIEAGWVDPNDYIETPGASWSDSIRIGDLYDEANTSLGSNYVTKSGHSERSYQEAMKNWIDAINNNKTIAVSSTPGPIVY